MADPLGREHSKEGSSGEGGGGSNGNGSTAIWGEGYGVKGGVRGPWFIAILVVISIPPLINTWINWQSTHLVRDGFKDVGAAIIASSKEGKQEIKDVVRAGMDDMNKELKRITELQRRAACAAWYPSPEDRRYIRKRFEDSPLSIAALEKLWCAEVWSVQ